MPLSPEQIASLRREYSERGLRKSEFSEDPIVQFHRWLEGAHAAGLAEPNGMTLSTIDAEGQPWSRTVLLKACDSHGFVFFTNYDGAKGQHLAADPRAAITFWWVELERQVNITGTVTKTPHEENERYFASRPQKSRWGAWTSRQSEIVADRATLEREYAAIQERFPEDVPLPPFWGGFCLRPQTIEFWQGRASRLHDRLRYTRLPAGSWRLDRLAP